jgi:hypothetical protein
MGLAKERIMVLAMRESVCFLFTTRRFVVVIVVSHELTRKIK